MKAENRSSAPIYCDMKPVMEVCRLKIGYGKAILAGPIDFNLSAGEVTALLGSNGIGKSTLLKTISGEIPAIDGKVMLKGKSLSDYGRHRMARMISIVTTERIYAPSMTVEELVAVGRYPYTGITGRLSETDRSIISAAMEDVGIIHKRNCEIDRLSDGERQKTMIARALAQSTPVIILDEPFSFLDVASRVGILSILRQLSRSKNVSILFSSHDVAQALRMADRLLLFSDNKSLTSATPRQAVDSGLIESLFNEKSVRFDPVQNDFVGF